MQTDHLAKDLHRKDAPDDLQEAWNDPSHKKKNKRMKRQQMHREVTCAVQLVERLGLWVNGRDEAGFMAQVWQEASELVRLPLGGRLLRTIGGVYENYADQFFMNLRGVAGVSTAWALSQRGQSVLLLEQNSLTSGSTWHAAGLCTHFKGSPAIAQLSYFGRETFLQLEREGEQIGWHQTGSLGIARSPAFARILLNSVVVGRELGHEHRVLCGPEGLAEVQRDIHPFVANPRDDFVLAVHSPNDGIVNPADATLALARRARRQGVEIWENAECVDMRLSGRQVRSVVVNSREHGRGVAVECGAVVLAASAWMRGLGKRLTRALVEAGEIVDARRENAEIPLGYAPHQYTIFEPIPGVSNRLPVIREYDHKYYCKPEVGSFMLGVFEGQPIPTTPDFILQRSLSGIVPSDAANEVFEEDVDKAGAWFEGALENLPVLQATGIHRWLHGPDTHSPDHGFLLGPLLALDNAFVASGFNSQGVQTGPGVGTALAQWILDGYPSERDFAHHFEGQSAGRVSAWSASSDAWVTYRALECYGATYAPTFPREQDETCRGEARRSALHERTRQSNGIFGEGYGWERPMYFVSDEEMAEIRRGVCVAGGSSNTPLGPQNRWEELSPPESRGTAVTIPREHYSYDAEDSGFFRWERAEALHCRSEVAAFDMSPFGKVLVEGPGAEELVDAAIGGNVASVYLNEKTGLMNGDLTVARLPDDSLYCVVPAADEQRFLAQLRRAKAALPLSAARFSLVTERFATLAVMGPKSRLLLSAAYPRTDFSNEAFPFGTLQCLAEGVRALRVSFSGELGWELHVDSECADAVAVYDHVFATARAARAPALPLRDGGMFALLESLRIERGFVHNGHDTHPFATPHECGLGFAVDLEKPFFLGQAALAARSPKRLRKRLVSVEFPKSGPEVLYRHGKAVGHLTSGGFSHVLGRPIGLGFVSLEEKPEQLSVKKFVEEARRYSVEMTSSRGGIVRVPVRVVLGPLVDPRGRRAQGDYGELGRFCARLGRRTALQGAAAFARWPGEEGERLRAALRRRAAGVATDRRDTCEPVLLEATGVAKEQHEVNVVSYESGTKKHEPNTTRYEGGAVKLEPDDIGYGARRDGSGGQDTRAAAAPQRSGAQQASRGVGRECEKGQQWHPSGKDVDEPMSSATNQVFVGNLFCDVDWHGLKDYMNQAGSGEFGRVLTEGGIVYGRSVGYGHVRFSTEKETNKAIVTPDETELKNQRIPDLLQLISARENSRQRSGRQRAERGGLVRVQAASSMARSAYAVKRMHDQVSAEPPAQAKPDLASQTELLNDSLPVFLQTIWDVSVMDIESTLWAVCDKVLKDISVPWQIRCRSGRMRFAGWGAPSATRGRRSTPT
ncbi:unnamed protein product [Prorocentrum cordatum]|uniref:RRM domain-containing protein n=1 Tax=Prorocentrum cordatum TaxID=2364126 RepID=A0ABN9Q2I7_9DINO|nr:unnamed protein product [Polarella glacialis]